MPEILSLRVERREDIWTESRRICSLRRWRDLVGEENSSAHVLKLEGWVCVEGEVGDGAGQVILDRLCVKGLVKELGCRKILGREMRFWYLTLVSM